VRIINKPTHGSVELPVISGYLRPDQVKLYPNCAKDKVKGIALKYKSENKYVGDDAFDLLVFDPSGWASVSDTRVWQFAVLPSAEAYCAATPTECAPFLGIAVVRRQHS
jgi:hypothetical protein